MEKVAVVILNWNGKHFLEKFLPALIEHTPEAGLYVADNNSTDDSISFLKSHYPQINIIQNHDNLGFCEGYNQSLKQVEAEYYVLLNSDIEVTAGWLTPLVELLDNHPKVAACQPKIKSYYQKDEFEYAGAAGGFIDIYGYPFCRGRIFNSIEKDHGQYNDITEVVWATGACMVVRSKLYHEVGGLDNDFFAHMEEIDLCWRLINKGYKIYYCGKSEVFHVGGGTLPKTNSRKTYLNFRNSFIALYKNAPKENLSIILFKRMILDIVASLKFLIALSSSNFMAVIKAYIYIAKHKGEIKQKRSSTVNAYPTIIMKKSIALTHFIGGKKTFKEVKSLLISPK